MKSESMDASWKFWSETLHHDEGFSPEEGDHSAVDKAEMLAKLIGGDGFKDMTHNYIDELIHNHSQPLTNEHLTEMMKSARNEEEQEELV